MTFAPLFMWNHICNAFVRNDGSPMIAMMATLFSSLFNIVFDYILMFPFGMDMPGAALATALSPVVGILICQLLSFKKVYRIFFAGNTIVKKAYFFLSGGSFCFCRRDIFRCDHYSF